MVRGLWDGNEHPEKGPPDVMRRDSQENGLGRRKEYSRGTLRLREVISKGKGEPRTGPFPMAEAPVIGRVL